MLYVKIFFLVLIIISFSLSFTDFDNYIANAVILDKNNGLSIHDISFEVILGTQSIIPTQSFKIGEEIHVKLLLSENIGDNSIEYIKLGFGTMVSLFWASSYFYM